MFVNERLSNCEASGEDLCTHIVELLQHSEGDSAIAPTPPSSRPPREAENCHEDMVIHRIGVTDDDRFHKPGPENRFGECRYMTG